ncbi:helix-turn-helix domain-containing protein [Mammaliicoccus sciuri]|uniref:Helix-turn-helix domain-containing protein n=1 Tax=Mammaliicoccus sciuri TaxID=1296 RepID=A0ABT7HWE3_MAMSC|nr:helix-turn-helix domain-containing protein [Mammaliicoccus sciuri]MDL0112086.1 helix-turn-helix domain-containing protein [Mammaliicoccus sciuri]MDL0116480.1 helix-turn-helix domain-containing protein [Mammaliicoccus sciuri]
MARVSYKDWITHEGLSKIEGWARDGLIDEQIDYNIGCSVKTLYNWKKAHVPILQALKRGKEVVDREVESSLHKRAMGYEIVENTKERVFNDKTGKYELVVTKEVTKHVAPDTTAIIFWLKNRKSEWNDKHSVEHTGDITFTDDIMTNMTEDELRKLVKLAE